MSDTAKPKTSREHLFWAREFVKLARDQAVSKGVPDHVMAQAMLVQAWMLFTGQSEEEAAKAVRGLFATSMGKKIAQVPGSDSLPDGTSKGS